MDSRKRDRNGKVMATHTAAFRTRDEEANLPEADDKIEYSRGSETEQAIRQWRYGK
jgi:hypothetical protein